jgi:cell division septation protein DedD
MRIILMLFGGVAVLIVAGIGYVLFMSPQQMDEVAIIKADERPYKIVPVNPGGADIKNTDSAFLNSLDRDNQSLEGGEQLLPEDPVPELPPIDITADIEQQAADTSDETPDEVPDEMSGEMSDEVPADAMIDETTTDTASASIISETDMNNSNADAAMINQPDADQPPVPEPLSDTTSGAETNLPQDPVQTDTDTDIDINKTASSGVPIPKAGKNLTRPDESKTSFYRIQLAAFKNEGKAMQVAAVLMNKHISRLDQVSIGVMLHDAGEQGVFYRVVTDPMPRANANKLCNTLKSVGQDCILRSWN